MTSYQLIFEGRIQEERDPQEVRQNLALLFDVPVSEIETLFNGGTVVLKDGLDAAAAHRDKAAFEATGALCRLVAVPPDDPAPAARPVPAEKAAGSDLGHRSAAEGRRYGLGHPYFMAFYFRPFYRDVARHWRGLAFVHLLILLALTGAAYILHFQSIAATFVNDQAPAIIAQIPTIVIEGGQVQVAVEQPHRIYRGDKRELFAVIDTSGQITSLAQTDAMFLLTRSRLLAQLGAGQSRVIDLEPIERLTLTREDIDAWLQTSLRWAPLALYPLMVLFSYCLRTLQILIYGGIGLVLAMLLKRPLPFGAAVSVAVMAMTPVIMVDTLIMLLKLHLPLWGVGSFVMAFAYLFFGIHAATEKAV